MEKLETYILPPEMTHFSEFRCDISIISKTPKVFLSDGGNIAETRPVPLLIQIVQIIQSVVPQHGVPTGIACFSGPYDRSFYLPSFCTLTGSSHQDKMTFQLCKDGFPSHVTVLLCHRQPWVV